MIKRFLKWLNEPAPEARELRVHTIQFVPDGCMYRKRWVASGKPGEIIMEQSRALIEIEKSDIEFLMESEA